MRERKEGERKGKRWREKERVKLLGKGGGRIKEGEGRKKETR